MNLKQFDGLCVRIIDIHGDIIDGICSYNNADYDEHEFGRYEESLEIVSYLFYRSDIQSVESLENHTGPYGKFLDPYGKLEEMAARDGIDSITDFLFCDDNEHVMRMLNCLDRYLDPYFGYDFPCRAETLDALEELCRTSDDNDIIDEAQRLIELWK